MAKGKGSQGKGGFKGKGKGGFGFGKGGPDAPWGAWDTPPGLGSLSWMNGDYYEDPGYASTWPTPDATYSGPPRQRFALQAEEPCKPRFAAAR